MGLRAHEAASSSGRKTGSSDRATQKAQQQHRCMPASAAAAAARAAAAADLQSFLPGPDACASNSLQPHLPPATPPRRCCRAGSAPASGRCPCCRQSRPEPHPPGTHTHTPSLAAACAPANKRDQTHTGRGGVVRGGRRAAWCARELQRHVQATLPLIQSAAHRPLQRSLGRSVITHRQRLGQGSDVVVHLPQLRRHAGAPLQARLAQPAFARLAGFLRGVGEGTRQGRTGARGGS